MTTAQEKTATVFVHDEDGELAAITDARSFIVDTGHGKVWVFIEDGHIEVSAYDAADLILRSPGVNEEFHISVDGVRDEPRPDEVCFECGQPATKVRVWDGFGRRAHCERSRCGESEGTATAS